jgi:hypothetical protein
LSLSIAVKAWKLVEKLDVSKASSRASATGCSKICAKEIVATNQRQEKEWNRTKSFLLPTHYKNKNAISKSISVTGCLKFIYKKFIPLKYKRKDQESVKTDKSGLMRSLSCLCVYA